MGTHNDIGQMLLPMIPNPWRLVDASDYQNNFGNGRLRLEGGDPSGAVDVDTVNSTTMPKKRKGKMMVTFFFWIVLCAV